MNILLLSILLSGVLATASFTANVTIKQCTTNGCVPTTKRIALDATSNHTSSSGKSLIYVNGNALTLTYGDSRVGGPRIYLIEESGNNTNYLFHLKNQEFTFDVELSTMTCGFNAALYFIGMNANEGGAEDGTNYCDAQAVDGTFCSEMDIMEANTRAQQYTTHACIDACGSYSKDTTECTGNGSPSTVCDQSGCGLNPFRYGPGTTYNTETNNADWYGPGKLLDSTQKFTVVTQFHTNDGTGSSTLSNITRFYLQNKKRIDLPTLYVLKPKDGQHMGGDVHPTLTSQFCSDIYDRWNGNAKYEPLSQMGSNMENGMVLSMSAWYSKETYPLRGSQTGMSWLDGTNNWGKDIKAGPCDTTTSDVGGPFYATFSDIRFGDIGTTTPGAPPAPGPAPGPAPSPSPPSGTGKCCYNGCGSGNCVATGFCAQSKTNCAQNCNGQWCQQNASS